MPTRFQIIIQGGVLTPFNSVYRHAMDDRPKEMNYMANNHFKKLMQHEMQHKNKNP